MAWKFNTSPANELKLKVKKFVGRTFEEVKEEKPVKCLFARPPS